MFDKFVTKKSVLVFSGITTVVLVGVFGLGFGFKDYCFSSPWCSYLFRDFGILNYVFYLALFPIVFLLSLLTFPLSEKIFRIWSRFSIFWILFTIVFAVVIPDDSNGGFFVHIPVKADVIFLLPLIYFVLSLLVIFVKSIQVYRKKK